MKIQTWLCATVLALPMAASAATVNFNTHGGGAPFVGLGGSFAAAEYAGVVINDSDLSVGSSFVNFSRRVSFELTEQSKLVACNQILAAKFKMIVKVWIADQIRHTL